MAAHKNTPAAGRNGCSRLPAPKHAAFVAGVSKAMLDPNTRFVSHPTLKKAAIAQPAARKPAARKAKR